MSVISRRRFVSGAAQLSLAPALVGCSLFRRLGWRKGDPFQLGVASGAPAPDGFVIWTRLVPEPLSPDPAAPGGMTGGPVTVAYEIAADEAMRRVVQRGTAIAEPGLAHAVHVEIAGLEPARPYWYRFTAGDAQSRIGRAVTAPAAGPMAPQLRFGFVSCSNFEHGYFSAYRHLADENPDLVLYLGDYIYEYASDKPDIPRRHSDGVEATSLPLYRNRYAQYRMDPDLQRLHATAPALATWDDHEVQNDYADRWSQDFVDPSEFLKRRAAAYQAYYEHMPLRRTARPTGAAMRIYERYRFGGLAEIFMLDGRQYRSRSACYGPPDRGRAHPIDDKACPERRDPHRTMLGAEQEAWLFERLAQSKARWNILGQDVMVSQLRQKQPDGKVVYWSDDWNGYPAARSRLLRHIHRHKPSNPVVLTGDIHSYWVNDVKLDFDKTSSPVMATEFAVTSVSAHPAPYELFASVLPDNPHVRFFESRLRGYASVQVTPARMTTRLQAISDAKDPNATLSTLKTFVVEDGKAGAQEA